LVQRVQVREQVEALEHHADLGAQLAQHGRRRAPGMQPRAGDIDLAAVQRRQAVDRAQQ
jgi:hypothetical protein